MYIIQMRPLLLLPYIFFIDFKATKKENIALKIPIYFHYKEILLSIFELYGYVYVK